MDEGVDRGQQRLLAGEVGEVGAPQPARALAERPLDRVEVGAAAQRQRHRLAESREPGVGEQPNEQHLAALERPARRRVGPRERQRVRDDLDLGDAHLNPLA